MSEIKHFPDGALGVCNSHILTTIIPDISILQSVFCSALPFNFKVEKAYVTLEGPITVSNPVITLEVDGTPIDSCSATIIAAGSSAGMTTAFSAPVDGASNQIAAGKPIEVVVSGGAVGVARAVVNIIVTRIS